MNRKLVVLASWVVLGCFTACSKINFWPTPMPTMPRTRLNVTGEFRIGIFDFWKDSALLMPTAAQAQTAQAGVYRAPIRSAPQAEEGAKPAAPATPTAKKGRRVPGVQARQNATQAQAQATTPAPAAVTPPPPPLPPADDRPTHEAGIHPAAFTQAIPAMLIDELHEQGRFAIYSGSAFTENEAKQHVDGYLDGTIVKVSKEQVCFELRLTNAVYYEVLYTKFICVPLDKDQVPNRDVVKRVAQELSRSVKQVGNAQITAIDGQLVYLNKGESAGIARGMIAYVVGTAERTSDPAVYNTLKDYTGVTTSSAKTGTSPVIVGQIYIMSTEDDIAIGRLYLGDYALPGDTAFFK